MEQKTISLDDIEEINEKELDLLASKFSEEIRNTSKGVANLLLQKLFPNYLMSIMQKV